MRERLNLCLVVISQLLLISCAGSGATESSVATASGVVSRVKVTAVPARMEVVSDVSTYTGNVEADVINHITPTMPGRIERIFVEVGDAVKKDDLLVEMESSSLQQQRVQLSNLERDYARYVELLSVGGIAQQQVDQLKTQIDVLKAVIVNLAENTQLRSPIAGIVTARNYDNGNVFAQQPILTVQQLNLLKMRINVSESYFTKVKVGMPVAISLEVYGDEVFAGRVSLIYPTIDASSHTFGVEVSIENRGMKVRPGMYARATLNYGSGDCVVIPDVAVQKQVGANDKFVYVIEGGISRYRKVDLGMRLGDSYVIRSGISIGDVVVLSGHSRLIDGTLVEVISGD